MTKNVNKDRGDNSNSAAARADDNYSDHDAKNGD